MPFIPRLARCGCCANEFVTCNKRFCWTRNADDRRHIFNKDPAKSFGIFVIAGARMNVLRGRDVVELIHTALKGFDNQSVCLIYIAFVPDGWWFRVFETSEVPF